MFSFSYLLITPAQNEEAYIEKTITSVISQTVLPSKWVIVSDCSTDLTDEIIKSYATNHPWIQYVRKQNRSDPYFSSQIDTFNKGYEQIGSIPYDYIGKLDADIELPPNYYETILEKFAKNPKLGIAGGEVIDYYKNKKHHHHSYQKSVAGGIHLLRRECYETIGGFIAMKEGGYDAIAEVKARMQGWETRTFTDISVYHLKPLAAFSGNALKRKWQMGRKDYFLGYHPIFEVAKCCFRSFERPIIIGSIVRLISYCLLWMKNTERTIPRDVMAFLRKEEMRRLFLFLKNFSKQ
jgi:poly-beta-1,6-N-acetyl-D-glucosamine synthase